MGIRIEKIINSYAFGRFQVSSVNSGGVLHFRDWLLPSGRSLLASGFENYETNSREQSIAFFQEGFLDIAYSSAIYNIRDNLKSSKDSLFWQFPCRTEASAYQLHSKNQLPPLLQKNEMHIYLGLPWATWIDFEHKRSWSDTGRIAMEQQIRLIKVRLSGIFYALADLDIRLRVHTVCQHIYWRDFLSIWESIGVTDLWLSHYASNDSSYRSIQCHPWHLYAVNVEDEKRNDGIVVGKEVLSKRVLASFVGAYMPHYLNDIRLRLHQFENEPDFVIEVKEKWHFEDVVYQHQIQGGALTDNYKIDASVKKYNDLLSDSVFSLCPVGAGSNTLRLWESLAVGSIPVLLGGEVVFPRGSGLESIDWDSVVLKVPDDQLNVLPQTLRSMSLEEIRRRQQACLDAYSKVKLQTCF